ncbi:MAG TPA: hypothetical protein VNN73_14320 [Blastocatellia bacterium]|nr:hypothetical protein [Blastocatellia bacterium]
MLTIITATVIALAVTYLILTRGHKADPNQLYESRYAPVTVGVQIICGDCAGDSIIPVKTYIDRFGNCSQCGGRSYLLASSLGVYAENARLARVAEYASASSNGRVIPFESPSRTQRTEKIAV